MRSPKVGRDQRVLPVAVLAKSPVVGENSSRTTPGASDQLFAADKTDAKGRASAPAGRARTLRPYDPTQQFFLPPSIDDWLPEDHPARSVAKAVGELLDLGPISASSQSFDGAPPDERAQRSIRDPDSRMTKTNDSFHDAYNAHVARSQRTHLTGAHGSAATTSCALTRVPVVAPSPPVMC